MHRFQCLHPHCLIRSLAARNCRCESCRGHAFVYRNRMRDTHTHTHIARSATHTRVNAVDSCSVSTASHSYLLPFPLLGSQELHVRALQGTHIRIRTRICTRTCTRIRTRMHIRTRTRVPIQHAVPRTHGLIVNTGLHCS